MNNYISRLYIHNFKSHKDNVYDFFTSNLILLDGPNGFGKSSLFDALELLFTGKIRRYLDIQNIFDGRKNNESIPFINNNDSDVIFIKAEIYFGEKNIVLQRKAYVRDLTTKINFSAYKLYQLSKWEDQEGEYISDETEYLTSFSGSDWLRNYSLYNYIEQEESLHQLKQSEKDRANSMFFMFNVKEEEEKLNKYQILRKHLSANKKLLNSDIKELSDQIKAYDIEYKEVLKIDYIALFPKCENINWDKEIPKIDNIGFRDLLKEGGELDRLQYFVNNRNHYYADSYNHSLEQVLKSPFLSDFVRYYYFFPQRLAFEEIVLVDDFLKVITAKDFFYTYPIDKLIYPSFLLKYKKEIEKSLQSIRVLKKSQDSSISLLVEFKNERDNFIAHSNQINSETGVCPLCNFQWDNKMTFLQQVEYKSNLINDALKAIDPQLVAELNHLNELLLPSIIKEIQAFMSNSVSSVDFAKAIIKLRIEMFNPIVTTLTDVSGEQWKEYLSLIPSFDGPLKIDGLESLINGKKKECDTSLIQEGYKSFISKYFNNDWNELMRFDSTLIEKKRAYLRSYWINLQKTLFNELSEKIELKSKEQDFIQKNIDNLDKVIGIFKNELTKHVSQIIADIEIIFHIYSGRILRQITAPNHGLFIKNEKGDEICFLSSCNNGNDALYSMSSGQLSGLILAFTLALNKRYSHTKFVFIDDPIQSMDDMNSWGLIELLRTEFHDSQIVISTHESDIPDLMSYKFQKMGLKVKRISMNAC